MKLTDKTLDRLVQKGLIKSYSYESEESFGYDGRIQYESLRIVFTEGDADNIGESLNIKGTEYRTLDIY